MKEKNVKYKAKRTAILWLIMLVPIVIGVNVFCRVDFARAETVSPIIINEIQTAGISDKNEFVELYNLANEPISLDGFKLSKKTKTGAESTLLSPSKFSGTIAARGYFLIANPAYTDEISADLAYSGSTYYISSDNTVLLYDKDGTLLDKTGFGAASDVETAPASNPDGSQSIERTDFIDTGDNSVDFSINTSPSPKNSSVIEVDEEDPQSDDGVILDESGGEGSSNAEDSSDICITFSENIKLNEIFPYPESGNEFVEITNTGENCVDISGWKVMDETSHKKIFPENSALYPGEYLSLEGNLYLNNDSDAIYLLDSNGADKSDALDHGFYEKAQKDFSYSFNGKDWQWTPSPTPGEANILDAPRNDEGGAIDGDDSSSENAGEAADGNVYLNEILPNPKDSSDDEYIEIASNESEPVDLFGWRLKDGSKSKGYQFQEHIILNSGEYFTIYRSDSKIALNNSNEMVNLFNPQGEVVSSAAFDKSQKNASFSFDGENWKWSKYLTPGKKNEFDLEPLIKIEKPKKVFQDIFAEFSAKAKDKETKKLKYVWDFGDGKKSYLAKASHKYLATGKYTLTLYVTDDSQTIEKNFKINVKKYPKPDLEIVKIIPNPTGSDTEGEIVEVRNNSARKIDLEGWKIATGSEKIYNHPIIGEINLGPNETKAITREISKFSLNNKIGEVQLIMPDGEATDVVEYQKEKIAEGEAYVKIGDEWQWIEPNALTETDDPEEADDSENTPNEEPEEQPEGEILGATNESIPPYAPPRIGYTSEDEFIFYKIFGLLEYDQKDLDFCPIHNSTNNYIALNQ